MRVPCPECGAGAEVTDPVDLPSTDGPVLHVSVACPAGHRFRMPFSMLTVEGP